MKNCVLISLLVSEIIDRQTCQLYYGNYAWQMSKNRKLN